MKTKLHQFLLRNKIVNRKLYEPEMMADYDYIICPISNARIVSMKSTYINSILGIQVETFDFMFPEFNKSCGARVDRIKEGLKIIDPDTGLSKHRLGMQKTKKTRSELDENGISGYKRSGGSTRASHIANINEFGRNGYQQQAFDRIHTILDNGLSVEQNAHIKQKKTLIENNICVGTGASKISKKVLLPILEYLNEHDIQYYFDSTEYGILDEVIKKYYFYDLTIPSYNIAIEYQSNAWHVNPNWDIERIIAWKPPKGDMTTPLDNIEHDKNKAAALLRQRGFSVVEVWEDTATSDVERILCLLKT